MTWTRWAEGELDAIRAANRWRQPRAFDAKGPHGTLDGRPVISFASNDYLGLSAHPAVIAAAHDALDRWGTGAGAARLIVGDRPVHDLLETELARWKGTDGAVIFPTGFMANIGTLSVFGGPNVTVVSDELNHASIIDGCRLSRSKVRVFRHRDHEQCRKLVDDAPGPAVVVTDTVFSMDGDLADLNELVAICREHDALLVLDEAHAVLGPELPDHGPVDVLRVGTLSKTFGSLGGFVAGPRSMVDLLVNRCRPFIFTTGSSPADTAAALAALDIYRSPEGERRRQRLAELIERVQPGHRSPIIPVVVGDERATLTAAAELLGQGILVPAIRPPTVPAGTSRLRVALSAAHTDDDIAQLCAALAPIRSRLG